MQKTNLTRTCISGERVAECQEHGTEDQEIVGLKPGSDCNPPHPPLSPQTVLGRWALYLGFLWMRRSDKQRFSVQVVQQVFAY